MSTSKNHMEEMAASRTYDAINRSIKALDLATMEKGNTLDGTSFVTRLDQLVTVYTAVKPIIAVLTTVPLIPKTWRAVLGFFSRSLDAVVIAVPDFKAGKDL